MLIKKFCAIAICFTLAGSAFAQQTLVEDVVAAAVTADEATQAADEATETAEEATAEAMLNEEGELVGKAVLEDSDNEPAADVKVSLTVDGKVVDETETAEDGTFAFTSVAPGAYQMLGSADGLIGSQSYDVVGYSQGVAASPCSLGMCGASTETVYDTCGSAPVSSFASSCGTCNACGSCGGGFGGGGGIGGGGLLSNPRRLLLLGGLTGGIIAIASDDDQNDASPDF